MAGIKELNKILCVSIISFLISSFFIPSQTFAKELPFIIPNVKAPRFPNKNFPITNHGAVGDGLTKNTQAFANAIQTCADAGGGKVVVPAGIWLTGPIQLKSNINLHLETGALILFSPDFKDYPIVIRSSGGTPEVCCTPPIFGENLQNIAITGSGIIDGSGHAWRPVKKSKMTESQWQKLIDSGGVVDEKGQTWYPSTAAMNGEQTVKRLIANNAFINEYAAAGQYLRPVMVGLVNCKNILLDGPTFQNSPNWNIHPLLCENMIIQNITVRNPWYSQNGDGLDPESCKNVIIRNCKFDVGDDAICMKSGKDEDGRNRGKATENVAIENCIVYHGHGGFVIGSEMSGGIRNIYIRNCSFLGTDTGLRFKSIRGRGGVVEKIYIQDIYMKDIAGDAVIFDLFYSGKKMASDQVPAIDEGTPVFKNMHFDNIVCSGAARAMTIQGLPELPTHNLTFENVFISAKQGVNCFETSDIRFKNVKIIQLKGPAFEINNSRNYLLENITSNDSAGNFMKLSGEKTNAIELKGFDKAIMKKIQLDENVNDKAIILTKSILSSVRDLLQQLHLPK
ncbi:MAG: hypothetical protein A2Y10_05245 [Planctomycetes bacterium GWF2_41_51]|nr:MAG: hypothetical protein A2Y10_05245 [Planctomycetes bacterium GWF2_41_51]